jgi:hypothetical protein
MGRIYVYGGDDYWRGLLGLLQAQAERHGYANVTLDSFFLPICPVVP